jgi:hypothetical protein
MNECLNSLINTVVLLSNPIFSSTSLDLGNTIHALASLEARKVELETRLLVYLHVLSTACLEQSSETKPTGILKRTNYE